MFIYNRNRKEPQNYFFQVDKIIDEDYLYSTKVFKNIAFWTLMAISIFTLIFVDNKSPIMIILYSILIAFAFYVIQYLFFVQLPFMMQRCNSLNEEINHTEKNIEKLNNLKNERQRDFDSSNNEVKKYRIRRDIEKINQFIKMETNHLDRVILCEKHTHFPTINKDNDKTKLQILENHYIFIRRKIFNQKSNEYNFLISLRNALKKLMKIIKENPLNIQLLENDVLIYLDELQELIVKYEQLTYKNKDNYSEKINYIASYITAYVDGFEERVDKSNMRDIDVGINVLLSELNQYSQKAEEIRISQNEIIAKTKPEVVVIKKQKPKTVYDKCTRKYITHKANNEHNKSTRKHRNYITERHQI